MTNETIKSAPGPHITDLHVGAQVRKRRKALGMSQEALANAVGLTFQQIQKYERGTNRISASKLHEIGHHLKVPIAYFFEGLPDIDEEAIPAAETSASGFLKTTEGQELAASFSRLSPNQRKGVMSMVRAILADNYAA
ncbi:helix-turn-helix domain-containing protein [Asticcacaulis taihuensis]|uniref:helix-turn-helix domain-containing protein n=1 Tax=Asticcacaulis taihuensis TaxID=260084 RepID=UPI0026EB8ADB|nr:helix-turn-helix transcriptional regulator [Asticcacaulis taihuensis]